MAGTNRFYTPSLPQYTSQFVEDRTPWDEMLAWQDQKYAREDTAMQGAAQAEGQFTSLLGGYRSGDLVGGVESKYTDQVSQWEQKYKGQYGSMPAMRELTKLQRDFQSDPTVKLLKQDREDNRFWDQMRLEEGYDERTDPNWDPSTGQLRQFKEGDTYRQYDKPYYQGDMMGYMNKFYDKIDPDILTSKGIETVTDPKTGQQVKVFVNRQRSYLGEDSEKIQIARDRAVQSLLTGETKEGQYYKQLYGENWNEDMARNIVMGEENRFYKNQPRESVSVLSSGFKEESPEGPNTGIDRMPFRSTKVNLDSFQPGGTYINSGEGRLGLLGRGQAKAMSKMKDQEFNKYYNAVTSETNGIISPDILFNLEHEQYKGIDPPNYNKWLGVAGFTTSPSQSKNIREAYLTESLYKDRDATVKAIDDYITKIEAEGFGGQEKAIGAIQWTSSGKGDRRDFDKTVRQLKNIIEQYDRIEEDGLSMFMNDNLRVQAYNAIATSNGHLDKDFPFDNVADIRNTSPEQWNKEQKYWVNNKVNEYKNDLSKKITTEHFIPFQNTDEDTREAIQKTIGDHIDTNGMIKEGSSPSAAFRGLPMIDPWAKNQKEMFIGDDERNKIWASTDKNPKSFHIEGIVDPKQTMFGSGLLGVTIGEDTYYLRIEDWAKEDRIENAAFTYTLKHNLGSGESFAVNDVDPANMFGVYGRSRWNWDTDMPTANDVYMQVRTDASNPAGGTQLVIYESDPNINPEEGLPKHRIEPLDNYGEKVDPLYMRYIIGQEYLKEHYMKYMNDNNIEAAQLFMEQLQDWEAYHDALIKNVKKHGEQ